ncbi:MAG TPA: DUF4352 domain-containing protein [Bryobacteraceae bacterium]|nr:DUF4352 domain-containing protein [Bryobacteraceae bacterium]
MHFARPRAAVCLLMLFSLIGAGCEKTTTFPVRTYPMGDKVALGHFTYIVFDTQWLTQLGDGPSARIPQTRFFLVRFSTVNGGSSEAMIPTMTIEDDSGRVFAELSNGDRVPQWVGFLRPLKPNAQTEGNIVFDAPPAHYKLRIYDENQERFALIDLPLTFNHETPPDLPSVPTR